jgi:hypothetical protein
MAQVQPMFWDQVNTALEIPLLELSRAVVVAADSAGKVIHSAPVTGRRVNA